VEHADIWVIERRDRLSLARETVAKSLVRYFESYNPAQTRVAALIHRAHATPPDGLQDLIGTKLVASIEVHTLSILLSLIDLDKPQGHPD
jgi:hypothetical protein